MEVITTRRLCKQFGQTRAAVDISISVRAGEVYGFLGLNGAGKTTLIRMLLGMIAPGQGEIFLFGKKLTRNFDSWNRIGYLVETPYAYPNLTVRENLQVCAALRKLDRPGMVDGIIERLKLTPYEHVRSGALSLGNQQRLGLAKAMMHNPSLLILDEPINGLDPEGIAEVRSMLAEMAAAGTTVFISSHILEEIARIAHRIAIIHKGHLIDELDTHELEPRLEKSLRIDTVDNVKASALLSASGYSGITVSGAEFATSDERALSHPERVAELLAVNGLAPRLLYPATENLEHFFLRTIHGENAQLCI